MAIKYHTVQPYENAEVMIATLKRKYNIKSLFASGEPVKGMASQKIMTLKSFKNKDIIIRVDGPCFIIDKVYRNLFLKE